MFNTKNLVHDIKDVPVTWVFEKFCNLPEKLNGQDIKIKSMFNPKERTPSMCIYYHGDKQQYYFKDFSTGIGGSALDLVKQVNNYSYREACSIILEKYNDYILHNNGGYDVQTFKQASKYKVAEYVFRSWNTSDQYFWTQFNIGSRLLDEYHVKPLEHYTLLKEADGVENKLTIHGNYIYGYFKADGTLYKIYQPKTKDRKFLKVESYIQGSEQVKGNEFLVITSSLKDIMSLRSLKLPLDVVAPDSENTMIRKDIMEDYLERYKRLVVMFDNDEAGIEAMKKYREKYPVELLLLPLSKDISDSMKAHGPKQVFRVLIPLLNRKLYPDGDNP